MGCSPGLTEVHAQALSRAPRPQEDVSRARTLSTAHAEPAQLALEEAELRILILSPGQEGRRLLRVDGSAQWPPVTCAVEGMHVPSRRSLAMYGLGAASVTCLHGPQRPRLPAGHPPLADCSQNSLPQQGLWGSEQSRQGLLLAWSCWAGGPAFRGALVQGASSSPTCLSPGDFALGCRQLGHSFPPEGRLHAVRDVSLDT